MLQVVSTTIITGGFSSKIQKLCEGYVGTLPNFTKWMRHSKLSLEVYFVQIHPIVAEKSGSGNLADVMPNTVSKNFLQCFTKIPSE